MMLCTATLQLLLAQSKRNPPLAAWEGSAGLTIGAHNGKSALHIQAKVEVPEESGSARVAKVHLLQGRHTTADKAA